MINNIHVFLYMNNQLKLASVSAFFYSILFSPSRDS